MAASMSTLRQACIPDWVRQIDTEVHTCKKNYCSRIFGLLCENGLQFADSFELEASLLAAIAQLQADPWQAWGSS
jgi:hypothetical protein